MNGDALNGADAPHDRIDPPAFLRDAAPAAVLAALPGARAVGGCVRDSLAGRAVHDVDVAAPLPPEAIARRLREAGLKVFETGLAHGTVTAVLHGTPVEVTALRRDLVTDGRHAEVAWTEDWREDAARRDFTFNAMSMDAEGAIWDYFGGRADLAAGKVRFVGDPATRLAEDYLRALRFFRFWARYGQGEPDAAALAAIRAAGPGLVARVAPERIWMELKRLLEAPDPVEALRLMDQAGLLAAVLPEADTIERLGRLVAIGAPNDPILRIAALHPDNLDLEPNQPTVNQRLARRFRLSKKEDESLQHLLTDVSDRKWLLGFGNRPLDPHMPDALLRIWVATRDPEDAVREIWLSEARDGMDRQELRARAASLARPIFPLLGRDVLAVGIPPGPQVGRLLHELKGWWLKGGCVADRETCLAELRQRLPAPS